MPKREMHWIYTAKYGEPVWAQCGQAFYETDAKTFVVGREAFRSAPQRCPKCLEYMLSGQGGDLANAKSAQA